MKRGTLHWSINELMLQVYLLGCTVTIEELRAKADESLFFVMI